MDTKARHAAEMAMSSLNSFLRLIFVNTLANLDGDYNKSDEAGRESLFDNAVMLFKLDMGMQEPIIKTPDCQKLKIKRSDGRQRRPINSGVVRSKQKEKELSNDHKVMLKKSVYIPSHLPNVGTRKYNTTMEVAEWNKSGVNRRYSILFELNLYFRESHLSQSISKTCLPIIS
ncbi:unnamed protein product [Protopolystoma xenopodis]|uniref:Uncharacterized protein n=1 Tax=Protopolystoma xenopodis TaxID=117903 RepID=A0A3S5B656_9PLAT|nr:unnamed protein product [Protopolystoma xenopodis]